MTAEDYERLSNDELRAIDGACDSFESTLQQSSDSSIEAHLAAASDPLKPRLLHELLVIELEYRVKRGEVVAPAQYSSRFPGLESEIKQAFDEMQSIVAGEPTKVFGNDDTGELEEGQRASPKRSYELDIPKQVGRYKIERLVGRGGMGTVYLARDTQLDRRVAIKVPEFNLRSLPADAFIERFNREARAMATVEHPNICPIYDVGEFDGRPYLTMAYVEGQPLSELVRGGGPIPPGDAVCIVRILAESLQSLPGKELE